MRRAMWKVTFGLDSGRDNYESRTVIAVDAGGAFEAARVMLGADGFDAANPLEITGLLLIARESEGAGEAKGDG